MPAKRSANRCKAKIWTARATSEIDGTIDWAALQLFRCIESPAEREQVLKYMQDAHADLLQREAARA